MSNVTCESHSTVNQNTLSTDNVKETSNNPDHDSTEKQSEDISQPSTVVFVLIQWICFLFCFFIVILFLFDFYSLECRTSN